MKELDFLKTINEIDPELLEDRRIADRCSRTRTVRRVLLAAAAVLLLGGTVFAVAKGIVRTNRVSSPTEDGVEAAAELTRIPWSSFRGEIQGAGEIIARQYAEDEPQPAWSSFCADPGEYTRPFADIDEAVAYIGLAELKTPTFPFDEYECSVTAHGDAEGRVDAVRLYAEHVVENDIGAQEVVTILTDAAQETELVSQDVWTFEFPRDVELTHYVTPGGNDCAIAVLTPQYDSEFMSLTGYVTTGAAFYELNLSAVPREKYDLALQMLHDWADALD